MSNATPAGWFPDPHVPGQQRYWDGSVWTQHIAPLQQRSQNAVRPPLSANRDAVETSGAGRQKSWLLRHPIVSGITALVFILAAAGLAASVGGAVDGGQDALASDSNSGVTAEAPALTSESEPTTEPAPVDTDGDGVADEDDFSPADPKVQTANDVDTDGDGVPDPSDDFPEDASFSKDTDGDQVADRLDDFPNDAKYSKDTDGDEVADSVDAFPEDPSRSEISLAMQNALANARDYLDYSAFSRQGLIDQLSSEYGSGFDVGDATWAVDQLDTDWKEQAVRSARDYLDYSSFSRQGLIDQLSSPYGGQFTLDEATYAVNQIGL